ncbi:DNA polymerase III subunit alpha [Fimbriiglobus ruber]|uniref:DNA polymerase III subunit alpha n=1 Tax=Fimbriiglobus ruber TaxID=1908690 RepID=A0A225D6C0_9BACT|nr:DNA polymerase III subunit alpha [Fimbriiglobus ruber]OWK36533.1 DNA polymerase III alpha subunit [Fimbriiglobus ruber]
MADRKFAHLHLHTHYSLLDGANRIPELVARTKAQGMTACAITDHGNLYGAIEFYRACTDPKVNINPVIGYEAYLAPGDRRDKKAGRQGEAYSHLTLLAKNLTGFKNLIKLSSIAFLEGFYYHPRIDREILAAHSEGLICLSGCLAGEFNQYILKNKPDEALKLAQWFAKLFKKDFYIEIQNNGIDLQDHCTPVAVEISNKVGVPLVATADAHYLCADDAEAHDVLFCINTGKKRDPRKKQYPEGRLPNPYYVRSPGDMYDLFPDFHDAVARSQEIADQVDIKIDFKARHFPVFKQPAGLTPEEYLRKLCDQGVHERYGDKVRQEVWDRLAHELGIINRMGFASYFLIVWDFVRFARENGIPASARGSGCGAVVSYVLYLSHVDPLDYDLLFERFLDPNRSEAPDIDIDFCQERRELVIQYVKQKYGADSVAQIGTFGTLAAKAALKDVGRVLDIPLEKVNYLSKLVPMKGAISLSLDDALDKQQSPDFRREYDSDPVVKQWVDIARKLEGMNRGVGTHAAGVVIANGPITDYVPVQRATRKGDDGEKSNGETTVTTQWEMGIIEKVGLLKMDFLGLRTLTLIDNALKLIKKTRGRDIDVQKLPLDDKPTYELLQRGDAKGVFQFESDGIRDLLRRMKPDNIRDIVACTALYRPGPLEGGMVDEYIECKHGRKKPFYPHPVMEEVLTETYGVMVYQEQVMRILNKMGGIELSSAYACIKAISKKNESIINARKVDFVKGAQERGMSEKTATEIFELIVKFGGYGFNKSHSAAYAHISYHTAYLKQYYPAEFMAALLSSEIDDGNKRDMLVDHIADARRMGVEVLPPNANKGQPDFDVVEGKIVFGLTAIKGLGRGASEEIVRAREVGGPFKDMFDFCERVDTRTVSKAAMEKMIKAGAMDCLAFNRRASMLLALPRAAQAAEDKAADRKRGQKSFMDMLWDGDGDETGSNGHANGVHTNGHAAAAGAGEGLPDVPEWPELDKLKFEKEALDFYVSSHPLAQFDEQLRRFRTHSAAEIQKVNEGTEVRIGGMITELIPKVASKGRNAGKKWAIIKVEDFTGQMKCILWSDHFSRFKDDLAADAILLFEGKVEFREGSGDVIVEKVMTLDQAKKDLTRGLVLRVPYTEDEDIIRRLDGVASVLKRYRGPCQVFLSVRDPAGRAAHFKLNSEFFVDPTVIKVDEIELLLGPGSVLFTGRS